MNKFELFIKQANFKDKVLQTASLNYVGVNVNKKSWTFNVSFLNNPTVKSLEGFIESLGLFFK